MDIKTRTAALSTGMNALLTCIKFAVYYASGSLAILAEAWHSFTDIATSLLVLIAVARGGRKRRGAGAAGASAGGEAWGRRADPPGKLELAVSLAIGLLLGTVSVLLLRRFFVARAATVENALPSGLLFILFSLGSYFVYRFETRVGRQEGSMGLVSDGMHAKADMTASLLTGFSLILYAAGLDLDRWVAGLIALFILSFAVETLVNTVLAWARGDTGHLLRRSSSSTLALLLDADALGRAVRPLKGFLDRRLGRSRLSGALYRAILCLPLVLALCAFLSTAFYTVGVREGAVVERFGRPLSTEAVPPGLHAKLPWPVDRVRKMERFRVEEISIGNVTDPESLALLWTRSHGSDEPFISGDNNYFYPYIVLHYRVRDVYNALYRVTDPKLLVQGAAYRIVTAQFAQNSFTRIATTRRRTLEDTIRERLQRELDERESGLEILSVNLKDIHPPISVAASFETVIAGIQEKQQIINEARGYGNAVLPESRARGYVEGEAARGYITDRKERAEGDSARFRLCLPATPEQRQITRIRMALQNLQENLKGRSLILVDPGAGEPDLWVDFDEFFPTTTPRNRTGGAAGP